MTPGLVRTFAAYNRWANERLYQACAQLDDDTYKAPRQAFFGSIHGTLNHILVGDRIWLGRISGTGAPGIERLDQVLYDDLTSLRAARAEEDARISEVVDKVDAAALDRLLVYTNMAGDPFETPLGLVFAHMFNHQTHHRGQVHDMLSQTTVPPPPLDLLYHLRDAA
ncbi:MAG: DinB family protein [Alphaproteobacteria bacterium]|nr:DinB family protein [Alphaproteobacteria bacterium]